MRRASPVLRVQSVTVLLLLLLSACTAERPDPGPAPTALDASSPATSATASSTPPPSQGSATPSPRASAKPEPDPISMAALIQKKYDGRDLKLGRKIADLGSYTRYAVSYRGDGLTISGIMNVPEGKGPFPVLVLNHGYIEPSTYFPGQGMPREQDYLARQGYVVLHVDYRNHAGSDRDRQVDYE